MPIGPDPLSLPVRNVLANTYFALEMFEDAVREYNAILELDSTYVNAYNMLPWCCLFVGEEAKAVDLMEKWYAMSRNEVQYVSNLGFIHARSGRKNEAMALLGRLTSLEKEIPGRSFGFEFAQLYNGLRDNDNALVHLRKAVTERHAGVLFSRFIPIWKDLRQDPRYAADGVLAAVRAGERA